MSGDPTHDCKVRGFYLMVPRDMHATQMMNSGRWSWVCTTAILCSYGFFKEFTPDEDFLTAYLDNETQYSKHFSNDQVNGDIYPVWAYSYLVAVAFVSIFTDFLRYKPVVALECVGQVATRTLLIYGTSVLSMQLMQVSYGISTAAEIAYYSYIYVLVSHVHFKQVTSYIEASRLFGDAAAGFLGQALVSTGAFNLLQLQYFSLASVCVATAFAAALPNRCSPIGRDDQPKRELLTNSPPEPDKSSFSAGDESASACRRLSSTCVLAARRRWWDFKRFYSDPSLLKWSVWWALATCGYLQIDNYAQSLWSQIAEGEGTGTRHQYNGVVEAVATLCASAGALSLSFMRVNWPVWGEVTIAGVSFVDSVALLVSSKTTSLWVAYVCYIVYRMTYSCLVTIAM